MLPEAFCWSRFGTEAGEKIESILQRKEVERRANDGLFLWGIGNSVGPGLHALLECCDAPEVLFSPIRSRPRQIDMSPPQLFVWRAGITLNGDRYEIPETIRVTSSGTELGATRHYALVCSSPQPLQVSDLGRLSFSQLRNIASGRALGASQVTAVVRRGDGMVPTGNEYVVALRVALVPPYFLRLQEPVPELVDQPLLVA